MIGEIVEINEGQKELIESVLAYLETFDRMFKRLMEESRDCQIRERALWHDLGKLAKEQYPDYDPLVHVLTWNWVTRHIVIGTYEQKRKGLLD